MNCCSTFNQIVNQRFCWTCMCPPCDLYNETLIFLWRKMSEFSWMALCILWSGVLEQSFGVEYWSWVVMSELTAKSHKDLDFVTLFRLVHKNYVLLGIIFYDEKCKDIHHSKLWLCSTPVYPLQNRFARAIRQLPFWLLLVKPITHSCLTLLNVLLYFLVKRTRTFTTPKLDTTPLQYSTPKLRSKTPLYRIHSVTVTWPNFALNFLYPLPPTTNLFVVEYVRPMTLWVFSNMLKTQWWIFINFCSHIDISKVHLHKKK